MQDPEAELFVEQDKSRVKKKILCAVEIKLL